MFTGAYFIPVNNSVAPLIGACKMPGIKVKLVIIPGKIITSTGFNKAALASYIQTSSQLGLDRR